MTMMMTTTDREPFPDIVTSAAINAIDAVPGIVHSIEAGESIEHNLPSIYRRIVELSNTVIGVRATGFVALTLISALIILCAVLWVDLTHRVDSSPSPPAPTATNDTHTGDSGRMDSRH